MRPKPSKANEERCEEEHPFRLSIEFEGRVMFLEASAYFDVDNARKVPSGRS